MSRTARVAVRLGARSYDVRIGAGACARLPAWLRDAPSRRAFVIWDRALGAARRAVVAALRGGGWEVHELPVRAGEPLKDIGAVYPIYGELLRLGADRHAVLVAVGGGTVGDAAGFVAATYMRGLAWVSVPTTLVAQVDSGIGGKTGINHAAGKNLIGAIHQPRLVVCDTELLATLPARELVSGFGEVAKIALTFDPAYLDELGARRAEFLAGDRRVLARAIEVAVRWKARAVSRDEHDRTGVREALNFGHTFGHGLEAATRYRTFRHGEAVLWGMRFAIALSEVRGHLTAARGAKLDATLAPVPVPPLPRAIAPVFSHMKHDKKARAGKIRFVLLERAGRVALDRGVTARDLEAAWSLLRGRVRHAG